MKYTLIRSQRKTISIRIMPDTTLEVRAPSRVPRREIDRILKEKESWIQQKLAKLPETSQVQRLTQKELRDLAEEAAVYFQEQTAYYAPIIGVNYGRITIRCQKSRWGSCSSRGNLNYNCLLMLCPPEVREYIVVHELCHRLELNHSSAFWEKIGIIKPDYKNQERWLKQHGQAVMARRPQEEI